MSYFNGCILASVFPILIIKWNITDTLKFETGRGFGASQGPGLNLVWQATDKCKLTLGGRYERQRFRLNDDGIAPDVILPKFNSQSPGHPVNC